MDIVVFPLSLQLDSRKTETLVILFKRGIYTTIFPLPDALEKALLGLIKT